MLPIGGFAVAVAVPDSGERSRPPGVKERILDAGILEFASLGYHGSSLRSIAERSRATKPMIYYHYHGKDGLYAAVVNHQLSRLEQTLRDRISGEGSTLHRLAIFARTYLTCFMTDFPGLAVGLRELPTLPSPVFVEIATAHSRLVVAILKQILRDGEASGELRAHDVENAGRAIIGIMHYYIRGTGEEPAAAIDAATRQVVDYYAVGLLSTRELLHRVDS
jgi:AcrR family transcriptional regulator